MMPWEFSKTSCYISMQWRSQKFSIGVNGMGEVIVLPLLLKVL